MILTMILLLMALIVTIMSVLLLSVGGAAFIVIFGDLIVCALFIVWVIKRIRNRKKK